MFTESRANAHLLHYSSHYLTRLSKVCPVRAMTTFYNNNIYTDLAIHAIVSPQWPRASVVLTIVNKTNLTIFISPESVRAIVGRAVLSIK